jgi:biotin synthase-related radical SAM superfamily protein
MKQTTLDNERIFITLDVARGEIYEKGRKSTNTSHIQ